MSTTAERIRAEFLEMPGLKLTLGQAARVFGGEPLTMKRLLGELSREGFLVRDRRGMYRRATSVTTMNRVSEAAPGATAEPEADLFDDLVLELPCLACDQVYRVSLNNIRAGQEMMHAGCQVRHFADCPPGADAHLIPPTILDAFAAAAQQLEAAAAGAGGRLVHGAYPGRTRRAA
jgi:hypothetical protein